MSQNIKIAPSILSANFASLGEDIQKIDNAGADYIHIDVMDGHFVPNITVGPLVIKAIRNHTKLPFDVHLMIDNPDKYVEDFANAGADIITIHAEATTHLDRSLNQIKKLGKKAGVSLVPSTPPDMLKYVIDKLDLILVMTVNPGFGGQSFLESQVEKIKYIKELIQGSGRDIDLEIDGGINDKTAQIVKDAGANVLVAGNYIFSSDDYKTAINNLK